MIYSVLCQNSEWMITNDILVVMRKIEEMSHCNLSLAVFVRTQVRCFMALHRWRTIVGVLKRAPIHLLCSLADFSSVWMTDLIVSYESGQECDFEMIWITPFI